MEVIRTWTGVLVKGTDALLKMSQELPAHPACGEKPKQWEPSAEPNLTTLLFDLLTPRNCKKEISVGYKDPVYDTLV